MWWGTRAPEPVPIVVVDGGEVDPTREATITVHVSGAVASPGLVQLVPRARVADAVAAPPAGHSRLPTWVGSIWPQTSVTASRSRSQPPGQRPTAAVPGAPPTPVWT
jgi:hypothetical protein